jgi:spoIIIJ-associated protein
VEENQKQHKGYEQFKAEGDGKTVAEAEAAALEKLSEIAGSFDRGEVELVVLSEGSKGFLGMGSNLARVQARLPEPGAGEATTTTGAQNPGSGAASGPAEDNTAPDEAAPGDEDSGAGGTNDDSGRDDGMGAGSDMASARLREYLETVLSALGLDGSVDISEDEESLKGNVSGSELGIFIGRHGQTIDAVQYLANAISYRGFDMRKRVIIDAEDYRERRAEALRSLAERGVEEIEGGQDEYELKPMSAAERRIIHVYLQERDGIETFSEGRDPYRRVIICRSGNR